MSGETQEVFQILTEIDKLLADIELKIIRIQGGAGSSGALAGLTTKFQQIERLALRWLALSRRMGLPEDVGAVIDFLARLITSVRMAQISLSLVMASNPVTAAIGFAGLMGSAFSLIDVVGGYY